MAKPGSDQEHFKHVDAALNADFGRPEENVKDVKFYKALTSIVRIAMDASIDRRERLHRIKEIAEKTLLG